MKNEGIYSIVGKNPSRTIAFLSMILLCITSWTIPALGIDDSKEKNQPTQEDISWIQKSDEQINTHRKGDFTLRILDGEGLPLSDSVTIKHIRHEFPWGVALDFNYTEIDTGNAYTTDQAVTATLDEEIYISERWNDRLFYQLPVDPGSSYKLSLKLAEIYFEVADSRLFDIYVEGEAVIENLDKFMVCGGSFTASDTTIEVSSVDALLDIEIVAVKDNASLCGIELHDMADAPVYMLNCGGGALTTTDGNTYESDVDYIAQSNASTYADDEDWMRATALKYFNSGVFENAFKWSGFQSQEGPADFSKVDGILDWATENDWEYRGHTLLWGGRSEDDNHAIPAWVKEGTPEEVYARCETHVREVVGRFEGTIHEYDVLNEASEGHATWLQSYVGDSISWNCYKWAREEDPNARLYINDYNALFWIDLQKYIDLIQELIDHGAPIDGIGLQSHFYEDGTINMEDAVSRLDQLSEFGLPIKFTEYDTDGTSPARQAANTATMMRLAFSYPNSDGLLFWSLWDGASWRSDVQAGIFDVNKNPKPCADTIYNLLNNVWTTEVMDTTDQSGEISFNGFYGTYKVEIDINDTTRVWEVNCNEANDGANFILSVPSAGVKGPEFISASISSPVEIRARFSKEIDSTSIIPRDYLIYQSEMNRIKNIRVNPDDESELIFTFESEVDYSNVVRMSYYQGTTRSKDGGALETFGPELTVNLMPGVLAAETDIAGTEVSASFNFPLRGAVEATGNFIFMADDTEIDITSISYADSDSMELILMLDTPVSANADLSLSYAPGTVTSSLGVAMTAFGPFEVTNKVPDQVNNMVETQVGLRLYPNPAINEIQVSNKLTTRSELIIYDSYGRILINRTLQAETDATISVSSLKSGTYFVSQLVNDTLFKTTKLVIQK